MFKTFSFFFSSFFSFFYNFWVFLIKTKPIISVSVCLFIAVVFFFLWLCVYLSVLSLLKINCLIYQGVRVCARMYQFPIFLHSFHNGSKNLSSGYFFFPSFLNHFLLSLHSVVANVLDYDIIESEFELQSGHYIHFRTNTLGKGMDFLIHPLDMD